MPSLTQGRAISGLRLGSLFWHSERPSKVLLLFVACGAWLLICPEWLASGSTCEAGHALPRIYGVTVTIYEVPRINEWHRCHSSLPEPNFTLFLRRHMLRNSIRALKVFAFWHLLLSLKLAWEILSPLLPPFPEPLWTSESLSTFPRSLSRQLVQLYALFCLHFTASETPSSFPMVFFSPCL